MFYNFDYGFIEGTRADDGDHTDALLIIDEPTFTGCHVWARPIGGLEMRDEKGFDFKILCVAIGDPHQQHIERLEQVRPHRLVEIEHFFDTYKLLENKEVDVVGWRDRERALEVLDRRPRALPARSGWLSDPHRLFVAVPLPPRAAGGLPGARRRRPRRPAGRRSRAGSTSTNLHLTVRFLGDDAARPRARTSALAVAGRARRGRRRSTWSSPGRARSRPARKPRALWLGIERGAAELAALADALDPALGAAGLAAGRPPVPPAPDGRAPGLGVDRAGAAVADALRAAAAALERPRSGADRVVPLPEPPGRRAAALRAARGGRARAPERARRGCPRRPDALGSATPRLPAPRRSHRDGQRPSPPDEVRPRRGPDPAGLVQHRRRPARAARRRRSTRGPASRSGPADLAPLFPMALILQEVSAEREIEIPDPVREAYTLYRPSPLLPRAPPREGARHAGAHLLQVRGREPGRQPQAEHGARRRPSTTSRRASSGSRPRPAPGQWGSALAFAGAVFGLEVKVYMVRASYDQKPYRRILMETYGASVVASPSPTTNYGRAGARGDARLPRLAGHGDQRGRRGRRDPRRHEVLAGLRAQPRAPPPDGHRPRGASSRWRWPARSRT